MDLSSQVLASLRNQDLPLPSAAWLAALVASRDPPPSPASLAATARARLLASDLTAPGLLDPAYASTHCLPNASSAASSTAVSAAAAAASIKETRLPRDVVTQVLDIEDVSRSRWQQVEDLEAVERGELSRGRQIIRLPAGGNGEGGGEDGDGVDAGDVDDEDGMNGGGGGRRIGGGARVEQSRGGSATGAAGGGKNATHKLVLQDCRGHNTFALELRRVDKLGVGATRIGEKVLLKKGAVVARGMVLLEPSTCAVLGGKVDAWDKLWSEGRLARLKNAVQAGRQEE